MAPRNTPFAVTRDPMNGIGLEERARALRFQQATDGIENYDQGNIMSSSHGPLPDPKWDAFFQAVSEAAGGKNTRFGYANQPEADTSRDPNHAGETLDSGMPLNPVSQQLGTPVDNNRRTPYDPWSPFDRLQRQVRGLAG